MRDGDMIFFGGGWLRSTGDTVIEVENPTTEEVLACSEEGWRS